MSDAIPEPHTLMHLYAYPDGVSNALQFHRWSYECRHTLQFSCEHIHVHPKTRLNRIWMQSMWQFERIWIPHFGRHAAIWHRERSIVSRFEQRDESPYSLPTTSHNENGSMDCRLWFRRPRRRGTSIWCSAEYVLFMVWRKYSVGPCLRGAA